MSTRSTPRPALLHIGFYVPARRMRAASDGTEPMHLSLTPQTRVRATDHLRFERRGTHTLAVAPGTGGWVVTQEKAVVALLERLGDGASETLVETESGSTGDAPVSRDDIKDLFRRGLLSLDEVAYGTSSSRLDGLQVVGPKTAHNQYPVLGVFHVHNWCNLACTYCYTIEEGVERQRLRRDLMCKAVDELLALPTAFTSIEFHGGEPTMALADIQAVTDYAKQVYAEAGKKVSFSIQTNGFNLSARVCDFLAANRFSVRVSIDGTPESHDEARVDHRGRGSYRGVVKGIRRLQESGVPVHAVCVVHTGNVDQLRAMYDSMSSLKVDSIRFLPVFKTGNAGDEEWLTGERYFAAYFDLVRYVSERGRAGERNVPLANLQAGELGALQSFRREYMCMRNPCGAGVNMIAIDTNGDMYPCEEMIGKQEFVIGNLDETTIRDAVDTSPVVARLRERHVAEIDECSSCTWKQLCHGGCVHKSYTHFKQLDRESEHCPYYKRIYRELIWLEVDRPGSWKALAGR